LIIQPRPHSRAGIGHYERAAADSGRPMHIESSSCKDEAVVKQKRLRLGFIFWKRYHTWE